MKRFENFNWEFDEEEEGEELTNIKFVKFLKVNGAYDKFIDNLNNYDNHPMEYKDWNSIDSFCDDISPQRYFIVSFKWKGTPEGYNYWSNLYKKWQSLI